MRESRLVRLVSIGCPELCPSSSAGHELLRRAFPTEAQHLTKLLALRNGFLAFESALYVRPIGCSQSAPDLLRWNSEDLWRGEYEGAAEGYLFFAEDVFGEQFGLRGDRVFRFDPETGKAAEFSDTLEAWASRILQEYEVETGYPLAHEWQVANGPLQLGQRLIPVKPFFLGRDYEIGNLRAMNAVGGMRVRADIYRQTRDLPEGTRVKLKVVP